MKTTIRCVLPVLVLFGLAACREAGPDQTAASPQSSQQLQAPQEAAAYGKYDNQVIMRIGFKVPDSRLNTGDSNDNNPVSRYLESLTNIKVVHAWEAKGEEPYTQKAQLAIDSSDLPDAMVVDRDQLSKLIDSGMIADLTGTFEEYGSSLIKDMYDSTGGEALADASRDGKLYGLPNVAINADSPTLLWVRQDWLDRLELPAPRTLQDIEAVAKAFVERDPDGNGKRDTVGLSAYRNIVYGAKPHVNGMDAVFNAFHAYPMNWMEDSSGKVVYGSITPETKAALAKLADWYKRGLIDPEFPLYKETQEPILSGKAGMFFGPWWMPYYPLSESVAQDTRAEWRAYAAPLDAGGQFVTHMAPVTDRYLVVRKGYEHPEAVVKLLNTFTRLERRRDPNTAEVGKLDDFAAQTGIQPRAYYPFDLLIDYADAIEKHYGDLQQALHGKIAPESLEPDSKLLYDRWMEEKEQPKKNLEGWKVANAYRYGAGVLTSTPIVKKRSVYYGSTPGMQLYGAHLQKLESETFLNIILGDAPIGAFDSFVAEWKKEGGDVITEEVEARVRAKESTAQYIGNKDGIR
ncbi:extracellular solute-binding protein [Paenibacillus sp. HN-1]|uniref:extracellular solute-binding protein n=1 Tax=Paenibacillus TaxID=44249 RepID=UPI001CA9231B|nr:MULTISPECIES: extracellular solute-binding protein [Paenibacillus]MBY9081750.1 extracellular solute-binding protein [Paenibacillus sp. CGMCC 1.18879]MBY9083619.1 extracellular solute-binding protein [Paenibacillus sinensis]